MAHALEKTKASGIWKSLTTAKFKDPAFDGDPEPPKGGGKKPKPYKIIDDPVPTTVSEPREKYIINGKDIRIAHEIVSVLGEDGKTMRTESVQSFARKQLLRHYQSLDDFKHGLRQNANKLLWMS